MKGSSATGARSTSQMSLEERREYIAKLRTERQERFGGASVSLSTSRPTSAQSTRSTDDIKRDFGTKELRRSDLQAPSPSPHTQPSALSNLHTPSPSSASPTFAASASPHLPRASLSGKPTFSSSFSAIPQTQDEKYFRSSLTSSIPPSANNNNNSTFLSANNNNTFLSSQGYDAKPTMGLGATGGFSSAFAVPPPDVQSNNLETKQAITSAQKGYNQWAEEKLKWWDSEGKRLQTFLSQMDDEWERHREATRRELEDEIAALKHESLVRANINQASKNLM